MRENLCAAAIRCSEIQIEFPQCQKMLSIRIQDLKTLLKEKFSSIYKPGGSNYEIR